MIFWDFWDFGDFCGYFEFLDLFRIFLSEQPLGALVGLGSFGPMPRRFGEPMEPRLQVWWPPQVWTFSALWPDVDACKLGRQRNRLCRWFRRIIIFTLDRLGWKPSVGRILLAARRLDATWPPKLGANIVIWTTSHTSSVKVLPSSISWFHFSIVPDTVVWRSQSAPWSRVVTCSNLLDHVEDGFIFVEPDVVVGDGDVLECDLFGVLEEGVGSPHLPQPGRGQQSVVGRQIIGKSEPIILPHLREENVGCVRLSCREKRISTSISDCIRCQRCEYFRLLRMTAPAGRKETPSMPPGPYNPKATMINQEHDLARDWWSSLR